MKLVSKHYSLQAIRRRFDKRIYIPLPEAKARQHMFKVMETIIEFFFPSVK